MEDQYKVAMELAYIDECLALEDAFEKLAKKQDYEGPRAREIAGTAAGAGVGGAIGARHAKKKIRFAEKNIPALEATKAKSEAAIKAKTPKSTAILGPEYYERHKGVVERAGKNIKKLQKAVPRRWIAPVAGAAAAGGITGAALMARRPKGKKLIAMGKEKARAAGSEIKRTSKKVQPYV